MLGENSASDISSAKNLVKLLSHTPLGIFSEDWNGDYLNLHLCMSFFVLLRMLIFSFCLDFSVFQADTKHFEQVSHLAHDIKWAGK